MEEYMSELTPAAREEIRYFLKEERKSVFLIGGVSLTSVVVAIGTVLSFSIDQIKLTGELAAIQTVESIRIKDFDPILLEIKKEVSEARETLEIEQRKMAALAALLESSKGAVDKLSDQAEKAVSDLNKVNGSFVFAETFSNISTKLISISDRLEKLELKPTPETRTIENLYPGKIE